MAIIDELTTDEAPDTPEAAVATTVADADAGTEMASEGGGAAPEAEAVAEAVKTEEKE
jgi:hypothetical protein